MLNAEQEKAAELVKAGRSVFIGGSAGVGKSYLIDALRDWARQTNVIFQICAPTGIAALNVKGHTIHSFFHLSPTMTSMVDYLKVPRWRSKTPWKTLSLLIIDEISMVSARMFDFVDQICRHERKRPDDPFGGLQVVLVGDFAQLGPVANKATSPLYAFEANVWRDMQREGSLSCVLLQTSQRHPDQAFANFMRKIRMGTVDDEVVAMLKTLSLPLAERDDNCYVTDNTVLLESLNVAKDAMNEAKHRENPNKSSTFVASYTGDVKRLKACLAPDILSLKIGDPVLHLANNTVNGLCNGSSGTVTAFDPTDGKPVVRFYNPETSSYKDITIQRWAWEVEEYDISSQRTKVVAQKLQIPLVLAYSISVHKSQSATLDPVRVNLTDIFLSSQAYVALSRARTKSGLQIVGLTSFNVEYLRRLFCPDPRVIAFYYELLCQ